METNESEIPRHNVIDNSFSLELSSVSAMDNGIRFEISVSIEDLSGSTFENEYWQLAAKAHGGIDELYEDYEDLCDWILNPCIPCFRELAPRPSKPTFSLKDWYYPRVYFLRVFVSDMCLRSERIMRPNETFVNALLVPFTSLPDFPEIKRFRASEVQIVPNYNNNDHLCDLPQLVQIDDGSLKYFKPAFDKSQCIREAKTALDIIEAKLPAHVRISKLCGIVISDNEEMALGLLVDWIPSVGSLDSIEAREMRSQHTKWKTQVEEIVQILRDHGIIWGDVNPGNIVIDENLDAWVIDFGGGCVEAFVDRKLSGTKAGDWQGIRRVFEDLADADEAKM